MTKTSNVFRRLFPLVIAIIVLLAVFIVIRLSFLGSNIEDSEVILFLGNKNIAPIVYYERGEAKGIVVDIGVCQERCQ